MRMLSEHSGRSLTYLVVRRLRSLGCQRHPYLVCRRLVRRAPRVPLPLV